MVNPTLIESIITELRAGLPEGLARDLESRWRSVLTATLSRLDLVTREELEVQSQVLAKTRARLEALEKQVERLENPSRTT